MIIRKLKIVLTTSLITTFAFAALAFTSTADNMQSPDPDTEVFYYHGAEGGAHIEPFDPTMDYGCTLGLFPCIISSDVPLGSYIPSDANISVVSYRTTK